MRDLDDVSIELRGLAATLNIISGAFLNDDRISDEVAANSILGLAQQVERLSDEVEEISLSQVKQERNCLKVLRKVRGISLEELENLTSITEEKLWKIENGHEVELSTREVAKLAEELNVLPSDIFPE